MRRHVRRNCITARHSLLKAILIGALYQKSGQTPLVHGCRLKPIQTLRASAKGSPYYTGVCISRGRSARVNYSKKFRIFDIGAPMELAIMPLGSNQ